MLLQDAGRRGDGVLRGAPCEELADLSVSSRGCGTSATLVETAKSVRTGQCPRLTADVRAERERTHRG